ncbi:uncharacterized protein TERG_00545 [Trichophyton rubrum CBS 118892]|uniref:TeaA receptor TeaR n=1 Tax=Trichophyton rubrum (strain ATCC MYA-4607 / CBS 118892) TaxID=559305 RepID=F2SBY6_TRIRC|nr:uncharacterized protein TERG_00545 [Trichophyton rubrum CBS 118892]EGD84263.1 hypothetical protein TERG_00545 [Trichophyton rubrum CBS 118892]
MAGIAAAEPADASIHHDPNNITATSAFHSSYDHPSIAQDNLRSTLKTRHSADSPPQARHSRHNHVNGTSLSRTSSAAGSGRNNLTESTYLTPHAGRKDSSLSRTHSEADSLLDLYSRDSGNRSVSSVLDASERKENKPFYQIEAEDPEHAQWIHRDKLAKIESEELQQLGIRLPAPFTGSKRGRGRSHEAANGINGVVTTEQGEQWPALAKDEAEKRHRRGGSSDARVDGIIPLETEDNEIINFDPRLPEEIAADQEENDGVYRQPGLRKSSSRIPVLASSHHPIPQEHLDRGVPLPRTRNNTLDNGNEDSIVYPKTRRPSESAFREREVTPDSESKAEITTQDSNSTNTSHPSPSKAKTPSKSTPTGRKTSQPPNNRKTSVTQKPKTPNSNNTGSSTNSTPNGRPGTRSGDNRPPSAAYSAMNRPDSDPPWLATMYKPDPRLPPDQQVIPTHAKRMQQEHWEREGKVPAIYDRDFSPLTIQTYDSNGAVTPSPQPTEQEQEDNSQQQAQQELQPLPEALSPTKPPSIRVKSPDPSGNNASGYKAVPNIQSTTPAQPRLNSSSALAQQSPIVVKRPPVKEKGCSCCIVM